MRFNTRPLFVCIIISCLGCSENGATQADGAVSPDLKQIDLLSADHGSVDGAIKPDSILGKDGAIKVDSTAPGPFKLTSTAFSEGQPIPAKFTCDGADVSPQLSWSGAPAGTVAYALICSDPDAPGGNFIHWVLYDVPASVTSLAEGVAAGGTVPGIGKQGLNDFPTTQYNGPCPPPGGVHHYNFTLYALSAETLLTPGATAAQVQALLPSFELGKVTLIGTYQAK
jgi:Raf kinase inhibitor-like YbhB/YbcL family protein